VSSAAGKVSISFKDVTEVPGLTTATTEGRVEAVILGRFGRVEADLYASGIVDSLGAMELLVLLQNEFQIRLVDVTVKDLSTVARIVSVVDAAMAKR
jgi:hypothetical protein